MFQLSLSLSRRCEFRLMRIRIHHLDWSLQRKRRFRFHDSIITLFSTPFLLFTKIVIINDFRAFREVGGNRRSRMSNLSMCQRELVRVEEIFLRSPMDQCLALRLLDPWPAQKVLSLQAYLLLGMPGWCRIRNTHSDIETQFGEIVGAVCHEFRQRWEERPHARIRSCIADKSDSHTGEFAIIIKTCFAVLDLCLE